MLTAAKNSKKVRGTGIDTNLKSALNKQLQPSGRVNKIKLEDIEPNPANSRKLAIPLAEFMDALKIGKEDSLVHSLGNDLFFPELDELKDLGCNIVIHTEKEIRFYNKIRELALSIHTHGDLLQPVECFPYEGHYMLELGHRRWYACHFVPNKNSIEALVRSKDAVDPLHSALRRWDENDKREDPSLIERLDNISQVVDILAGNNEAPVSQVEVAKYLSIPKYEMSYYMKVIKSDLLETEKSILSDNNLNELRTVADICRIDDLTQRYKAFEIYQDKGNSAARSFVKRFLQNRDDADGAARKVSSSRSNKVTPSQKAVTRLVSVLKQSYPAVVEDIDEGSTPSVILEAILKRLEEELDN